MTSPVDAKPEKKHIHEFLLAEYSQCFDQMRHYEDFAEKYFKHAVTGYPVIIGGISALYTILSADYRNIITSILLLITFFAGLVILALLFTNRSYFVVVARQINAIRKYFLDNDDRLDFKPNNRAYYDPTTPKAYNPKSSFSRIFDIVTILNSLIGGGFVFFLLYHYEITQAVIWTVCVIVAILLIIGHKIWARWYLKKKDQDFGLS